MGIYETGVNAIRNFISKADRPDEPKVVGIIYYEEGEKIEFSNPQEYLDAMRSEYSNKKRGGFYYQTVTQDPHIRKAADDIFYAGNRSSNPHNLFYYEHYEKFTKWPDMRGYRKIQELHFSKRDIIKIYYNKDDKQHPFALSYSNENEEHRDGTIFLKSVVELQKAFPMTDRWADVEKRLAEVHSGEFEKVYASIMDEKLAASMKSFEEIKWERRGLERYQYDAACTRQAMDELTVPLTEYQRQLDTLGKASSSRTLIERDIGALEKQKETLHQQLREEVSGVKKIENQINMLQANMDFELLASLTDQQIAYIHEFDLYYYAGDARQEARDKLAEISKSQKLHAPEPKGIDERLAECKAKSEQINQEKAFEKSVPKREVCLER